MRRYIEFDKCACGRVLHYTDPAVERMIRQFVEQFGEFITVTAAGVRYRVQRHYIALHGLAAQELPELASRGVVEVCDG
jgi:hypothetical protein